MFSECKARREHSYLNTIQYKIPYSMRGEYFVSEARAKKKQRIVVSSCEVCISKSYPWPGRASCRLTGYRSIVFLVNYCLHKNLEKPTNYLKSTRYSARRMVKPLQNYLLARRELSTEKKNAVLTWRNFLEPSNTHVN